MFTRAVELSILYKLAAQRGSFICRCGWSDRFSFATHDDSNAASSRSSLRVRLSQAGVQRVAAPRAADEHRLRVGVPDRPRRHLLADLPFGAGWNASRRTRSRWGRLRSDHRVSLDRSRAHGHRGRGAHFRASARERTGGRAGADARGDREGRSLQHLQSVGVEPRG